MKKLILGLIAVAVVAGAAYLAMHRTPSGVGAPAMTDRGVPNPLRVATEGAYPPFNVAEPDGTLKGFEIDLAKDLCRRMGVKCEIAAQAWDGIIPGLQAGKYDVILAGMSATDERRQAVDFTVDAYPNRKFHGKVFQIRNSPQTTQNVVSYDVMIAVDNSDLAALLNRDFKPKSDEAKTAVEQAVMTWIGVV